MLKQGAVVVIDWDLSTLEKLGCVLSDHEFQVEGFGDADEAKVRIADKTQHTVGLAIVNWHMSCVNGASFRTWAEKHAPHMCVMFYNGSGKETPPSFPGVRLLPNPPSDHPGFVELVRQALRDAAESASRGEMQESINRIARSTESQAEVLGQMGRTLTVCVVAAQAAKKEAGKALALAKRTPTAQWHDWWRGLDPLVRWTLRGVAVATGTALTWSLWLGSMMADGATQKARSILTLEGRVSRIEPAVQVLRQDVNALKARR